MINFNFDIHKLKRAGMGAALGLAAGVLFTSLAAYRIISGERSEAAAAEAELTAENEELKEQIKKEKAVEENTETLASDADGWQLILVNEDHPLDPSYTPEKLTEILPGYPVDDRILADLKQMMDDGAAQGLSMYVTSAYRSYDQQIETFNASMQNRLGDMIYPKLTVEKERTVVELCDADGKPYAIVELKEA